MRGLSVRSVGAGLCLTAILIISGWSFEFFRVSLQDNPLLSSGIGNMSPGMVVSVAWVLFCAGVGLFAGAVIVPFAEIVLRFIFSIPGEILNFVEQAMRLRRKNLESSRGGRSHGGRESEFSPE